jgi:hypothetical protein
VSKKAKPVLLANGEGQHNSNQIGNQAGLLANHLSEVLLNFIANQINASSTCREKYSRMA